MKKRIFSLALASVMTLSLAAPVFATATLPDGGSPITGSGSTSYIDLKVTSTSLPTSAAFNFVVDPLGLASVATGGSKLVQELEGGSILATKVPAPFVNKSSYPVKVTVAVEATGDATFLTAPGSVEEADVDATNALLYVMPSATSMLTGANFTEADNAIPVTPSPIDLTFGLPAAKFAVKNVGGTYSTAQITNSERGTALSVGGYVNSKADWTSFSSSGSSKIGISVTFTFEEIDDSDYADLLSGNSTGVTAYGISGSAVTGVFAPAELAESVGPSVDVVYEEWDESNDVVFTVSLGEGASAATTADFATSTVELISNGVYTKKTLSEMSTHFTSATSTSSPEATLTMKKTMLELASINYDTDIVVTFKFKDANGTAMTRNVMSIVHKPAAS